MNAYEHNLLVALHGKIIKRANFWHNNKEDPNNINYGVYVAVREVANAIRDLVQEAGVKPMPSDPDVAAIKAALEFRDPIPSPVVRTEDLPKVQTRAVSPPPRKPAEEPLIKKLRAKQKPLDEQT